MKSSKTEVLGKAVFLLNGAKTQKDTGLMVVQSPEKLLETARKNPDAVAFGYLSAPGCWVAAA